MQLESEKFNLDTYRTGLLLLGLALALQKGLVLEP